MKVKKYIGRKILLATGDANSVYYIEEKRNILRDFEDFKNDVENGYYTKIELLEDNIELYKCQTFKTSNLSNLANIYDSIAKKNCSYKELLTKKEIVDLLKDDYVVCLEGNKEITLEEAENL